MSEIEIYTDGACSGNPGPGGWAAIVIDGEDVQQLTGGEPHTTNNRMELMAAIQALEALDEGATVSLHTDSAYVSRAFNEGWLENWQDNGWKTSSKKPVKNKELWQRLLALDEARDVTWIWVKGHADNELNNLADALAVDAMEQYK
jgi:ribonuclease HI